MRRGTGTVGSIRATALSALAGFRGVEKRFSLLGAGLFAGLMLLGLVLPALPASAQEGVHYAYWDKGKGKLPAGARVIEDYGGFVWISSHEAPRAGEVVVRPLILFDGETIDPQASPSMSADDLSALPQANDAFLLQLAGPVKTGSWQEAIESTGLRIVNYVPDFTFLVWGTPAAGGCRPAADDKLWGSFGRARGKRNLPTAARA